MKFSDLVVIWGSLKGHSLARVGKGSPLQILEVDNDARRLIVKSDGQKRSRSFAELERVWDALRSELIVHVDSVLAGSGTSRNQPETLFAALPFVEYTRIKSKKHLVLADGPTHQAGTLKKASAERVTTIQLAKQASPGHLTEVVIPVADIRAAAEALERLTGKAAETDVPGEYVYRVGSLPVRLVSESTVDSAYRGRTIVRGGNTNNAGNGKRVPIGDGVLVEIL